jgi:hypothetical protein
VKPSVRFDGRRMIVKIPLKFERHGARKRIIAPNGAPSWALPAPRVDNTLVKTLARAHRWRRMLESGEFSSITELAAAEKINMSYMCRVLPLTLLSPQITESILNGQQDCGLTLDRLAKRLPLIWSEQSAVLS